MRPILSKNERPSLAAEICGELRAWEQAAAAYYNFDFENEQQTLPTNGLPPRFLWATVDGRPVDVHIQTSTPTSPSQSESIYDGPRIQPLGGRQPDPARKRLLALGPAAVSSPVGLRKLLAKFRPKGKARRPFQRIRRTRVLVPRTD